MIEYALEHIHVLSGMPWWGSIAVTAVALRLVTLPFYLKASDINARQSALVSVTKPITARMTECQRAKDHEGTMLAMRQLQAVRARAGITWRGQMTPLVLQGIIGFCGFKLIRALASLPVPGFGDGGFLWLSDLTAVDPWGIMPVAMGASMHLIMRLGGESGAQSTEMMTPGMKNMMLYGFPGIIMLIMSWQPGALCVWFAASGALGIGQALLLQRPAVRKALGIAPLYKPSKEEAAGSSPLQSILDAYKPAARKAESDSSFRPDIGGGGKSAAYMQPQWQAPNINRRAPTSSGRVIDVKPSSPSRPMQPNQPSSRSSTSAATGGANSDMIPPPQPMFKSGSFPGSGIVNSVRGKLGEWQVTSQNYRAEQSAKNAKEAKKKAADAYEKRAKERGGVGRGR